MKGRRKKTAVIMLAVVLAVLAGWTLWGNTALEVNTYTVYEKNIPTAFSGFRIAQISDLHNAEFGPENEKLLSLLSEAKPDIIVITGDLVDSRRTDIEIALQFAESAAKIAPVYYVSGNHESRIDYASVKEGLLAVGVRVLENEKLFLEKDGQSVTLMGLSDPDFPGPVKAVTALETLMEGETGYTILLSHRPELFEDYVKSGADLVFSGHAHGGQFRLPFVGGLVAPGQGFFPKYDAGLFTEGTTTMVVSRGIGNSIIPIRFNNRPELILVELICA